MQKCSYCGFEGSKEYFYKNPSNKCKGCSRRESASRFFQLKYDALVAYSSNPPECYCCSEQIIDFLTLDHANNDGAKHREDLKAQSIKDHSNFLYWLRRNNYPKNLGLRVLCFNCNCGRKFGDCPHKQPRVREFFERKVRAKSSKWKCECGKDKHFQAIKCRECSRQFRMDSNTKISWPSVNWLIDKKKEMGWVKLGKLLGVSDSSVRRYLKRRGITNLS